MTTTTTRKQEAAERLEWATRMLRDRFPPGSTVYTVLDHVSRSGMLRHIRVLAHTPDGIDDVTYMVAIVCDFKRAEAGGLKVSGCGMDMGFSVAYDLSWQLYRDGFECTGKDCPSNDHSNGDRDYTPHRHEDGGYCLKHRQT